MRQLDSVGEAEDGDVAVLENVILAFEAVFAGFAGGGDAAQGGDVLVGDDLGLDEALLEIGVDHAGGLRGLGADVDRPSADLLFAGGEVGLQPEQGVGGADQRGDPGVGYAEVLEKLLGLLG